MIRTHRSTVLLFVLYVLFGSAAFAQFDTAVATASSTAREFAEREDIPGLAVTVAFLDGRRWSAGYGYSSIELQVPVDAATTKFRVGSTAKSMTAMAVGQLYESGKLDLDARIQRYLPDYPEKRGPITSRQLGGHLSGTRHYAGDEFLSAVHYESVTDALSIFRDDPLMAAPGSAYLYSTYGFNLLSAVVEAASGEEFLDYMQDKVFTPVGMANTVADRASPLIEGRSGYYQLVDGQLENAPWVDNSNKWAGGGFLSTSEDLVRFALAHLTDAHLKAETVALLWTPQKMTGGEATTYGIGWDIRNDPDGRRLARHSGGSVGGRTEMRIYRDSDMAIAVITNTSDANLIEITSAIAEPFLALD